MISILAVSPCYPPGPGGAEASLHETLRLLVQNGFVARVITLADHPLLADFPNLPITEWRDSVLVHRCPAKDFLVRLQQEVVSCDIVFYQQQFAFHDRGLDVEKMLEKYKTKVVYFIRSNPAYDTCQSPFVVANSRWVLNQITASGKEAVLLLPPVTAPPTRPRMRRQYVTMINPTARKGGALFVELARRFPDVPFLAQLGWGCPVPELGEVPNIIIRLPTDRMVDVYAETLILLVPSHEEPFGRTALEGALAGCLILAHHTQGLAEVPLPASCFVESLAVEEWERLLSTWLSLSQSQRRELRRTIRAQAETYDCGLDVFASALIQRFGGGVNVESDRNSRADRKQSG